MWCDTGRRACCFPPGELDALEEACHRLLDNPRLRRTLGRAGAKLVHTHYTWDRKASRAVELARSLRKAKGLGLPFLFTAHGYDIRRKAPADFAERASAARAVVTVSNANARCIAATFGVPPDRIHVIPCGVDTDRFRPVAGGGAARHQSN